MSERPTHEALPGSAEPLGATVTAGGVNFALWSHNGVRVELCLYDAAGEQEIGRLDLPGRTGDVWHGFVPGLAAGLCYGYRVHGPMEPQHGHRFNPAKLLIDPYARELTGPVRHHEAQFGYQPGDAAGDLSLDMRDDAEFVPKCRIVAEEAPSDTGPRPRTSWRDTVIYELHVRGFSKLSPFVPEAMRGTFAGLGSDAAVRHLQELGVTAVDIMPIAAHVDEPHLVAKGLTNYWGYNPVAFMAPEPRLARADARSEIKAAVRRLHEAAIEVLLDVVFNHSGDGWHLGPTLSLKGIDNAGYYRLVPGNESRYVDHAGCGNTLDLSRPHVRRLALDALRMWVRDYGVDGFRFDLATVLGREGENGEFSAAAALFSEIASDPLLADVKLIAEPWDLGPGGYRLGGFPAGWVEWNDRSRDAIRRFWRGDRGVVGELATRLAGSADKFASERGPLAGINFVAAHDGMRLRDLVMYSGKRNAANGEDNRDGTHENFCVPCGADGPSDDEDVVRLRVRQMKNMLSTLLLSQGVPMLAMGDEIGHSQGGNNNAYCQDNRVSWIDWSALDGEARDLLEFTRHIISLRSRFLEFRRTTFLAGAAAGGALLKDVTWLAPGGEMTTADWQRADLHCLGMFLAPMPSPDEAVALTRPRDDPRGALLILLNGEAGQVSFALPSLAKGLVWTRLADTSAGETGALRRDERVVTLSPQSLMVLAAVEDEFEALDELCDQAGVARIWHDLSGVEHRPSVETRRALLGALGFAVGSSEVEKDTLARALQTRKCELVAPVVVVRVPSSSQADERVEEGAAKVAIAIALGELARSAASVLWTLRLEDGAVRRGGCVVEQGEGGGRDDGREDAPRRCFRLPVDLPLGYHELEIEAGESKGRTTLIIAPEACWQPEWLDAGDRVWGVAHQLYSLRPAAGARDWGIGDFTLLGGLSDAVARHGGAVIGVNPLNALSLAKPEDGSPYAPSSRQFLNPLYIDVAAVMESAASFVPRAGLPSPQGGGEARPIDYASVARDKLAALWLLFERFEKEGGDERVDALAAFVAEGGAALQRFATHQVLEEMLGRAPSAAWTAHADASAPAVAAFARENERRIRFHCWLQFEADRQLRIASDSGLALGLYGDLAVGIDPHGSDVWSEPQAFVRGASFGAPPDPFSAEGQDWGLLAFDPLCLKRTAYRPFRDMLAANMRHARAIRLDHVMWLERMFFIPHGSGATDGTYVAYPRDELFAVLALESHRNRCLVVGEDLGTVPLGFREAMGREGILSYKLMAFERYHDGFYVRPDVYPRLALATPGSHDWPTIAGWWSGHDIEVRSGLEIISVAEAETARVSRARDRELLAAALTDQELVPADFPRDADLDEQRMAELATAVHRFLARSPAALLMLNLEDLALSREQVNLPGPLVGYPCWRVRMDKAVGDILGRQQTEVDLAAVAAEREATLA